MQKELCFQYVYQVSWSVIVAFLALRLAFWILALKGEIWNQMIKISRNENSCSWMRVCLCYVVSVSNAWTFGSFKTHTQNMINELMYFQLCLFVPGIIWVLRSSGNATNLGWLVQPHHVQYTCMHRSDGFFFFSFSPLLLPPPFFFLNLFHSGNWPTVGRKEYCRCTSIMQTHSPSVGTAVWFWTS